ncbi:MAG: 6-phosphogluconolactonase [Steroidobacteraceae bacterium]
MAEAPQRTHAPLLRRFPDHDALAQALAADIARRLRRGVAARGAASLLVPGGHTPVPFFEQLAQQELDWSRITVSPGDERWVPPGDAASNEHLLRRHLLHGEAAPARVVGLWNDAPDPAAGASRAWQQLAVVARPFDAVVLGMGEDGHFASLFPGDAVAAQALEPDQQPACVAVRSPAPPVQRLSLNLAALLQTRALFLLITGEAKWELLLGELDEATTRQLPVRALLTQSRIALTVCWSP